MKERPILFSGPMVRAILEGRKTQTRRLVKPQPRVIHAIYSDASIVTNLIFRKGDQRIHCPYGKPGDRLWVKEKWRVASWTEDGRMAVDYAASPELVRTPWKYPHLDTFVKLRKQSYAQCERAFADCREGLVLLNNSRFSWDHGKSPCSWRPSIHMPRWASRITMEIVSVRVERLQDISYFDAYKEGAESKASRVTGPYCMSYVEGFKQLWESINGHGSWDLNPYVWVIEFKEAKP